jgi:hypothetical protein
MSDIGILGVVGLAVIVLVLVVSRFAILRAKGDPVQTDKPGGKLKRGPVSGGAIRGEPGQRTLTGEAPRQDDPQRDVPDR